MQLRTVDGLLLVAVLISTMLGAQVTTTPSTLIAPHQTEHGTVKWFNQSKGFGFISRLNGEDVFVDTHAQGSSVRTISEGQAVDFIVVKGPKGLQAEDVRPTTPATNKPAVSSSANAPHNAAPVTQPREVPQQPAESAAPGTTVGPQAAPRSNSSSKWATQPEWWLVAVGFLTLGLIWWQAKKTADAATATQRSVAALEAQTSILKDSVTAAEKNADAARDAAMTSRISTETMLNSERAWVLAELGWNEGNGHVLLFSGVESAKQVEKTNVCVRLTCRNEGRTPAWIDRVRCGCAIVNENTAALSSDKTNAVFFGSMGALGAGKADWRKVDLTCEGHPKANEFISVYALIEYHDILGLTRETGVGYSIIGKEIRRQDDMPQRQTNS